MAHSVIGFHYSLGGNKNGIGPFMDKLNAAGIPFLFKGTDDAGLCFEGQQKGEQYGVENHLIYRVSTAGQNNGISYDVPDYTKSPLQAAQEHFNKTAAKWPPELDSDIVWMEPINEPRAKLNPGDVQWNNMNPVDWLGWFMVEYAIIANDQGFKVCGPGFNGGEPEVFSPNEYEQPGMLAYLDYCANNPTKAALSVHCYTWDGWQQGQGWNDWYPSLWGRVEAAVAAADKNGIGRTFNIYITEWGFAYQNAPRWPECEPYLTDYNKWAARFPQVKGAAAWTLASGWGDVDQDLQTWFSPLGDYAVNTVFDPGPQPAATAVEFGSTLPGDEEPMPNNLLPNASWELGWDDTPYGHIPKFWEGVWIEDGTHVRGEGRVFPRAFLPPGEWPLYYFPPPPDETSQNTYKFFKDDLPIRFRMSVKEPIDLPAGKYKFSARIYPDIYTGIVNGQKVWSDDPGACMIRPFWNGVQGLWQSLYPYGGDGMRLYEFTRDHPGGLVRPGFQVWCPKKDIHNGVFVDDGYLVLADVPEPPDPPPPPPPPPPPTGTLEERLWAASVAEQIARGIPLNPNAGLQAAIFQNQQTPVHREIGAEGYQIQAGESVDGSKPRRVYVYQSGVPIWSFEEPEDNPDNPFDGLQLGAPFRVPFVLTSPFNAPRDYGNLRHEGSDYDITNQTPNSTEPVLCLYDGTVYRSENNGTAYGHFVVTKHTNNGFTFYVWYAHMDARFVVAGQVLKRGDPVGELGATGGNWGEHVHINLQVPGFGLSGYVVSDVVDPAPFVSMVPEPSPGIEMAPYIKGDGRLYEVKNEWGSQQRHQSQAGIGSEFFQTKDGDWEQMFVWGDYIVRDIDTSPGNGRYYRLKEGNVWGSAWVPRKWSVGDTFTRSRFVQFFKEAGCVPDPVNSGNVTDTMRFVAKHGSYVFQTGITLPDVVELEWVNGPERYLYAKNYGLVGWQRLHEDPNTPAWSAISEEHAPGARPDNVKKVIGCL